MKLKVNIAAFFTALFILLHQFSSAQNATLCLQQIIQDDTQLSLYDNGYGQQLKELYSNSHYTFLWFNTAGVHNRDTLFDLFGYPAQSGLNEIKYQDGIIKDFAPGKIKLNTGMDSAVAELRISSAALKFFAGIAYGETPPELGYNGLHFQPSCYDIPAMLYGHLQNNTLSLLAMHLQADFPGAELMNRQLLQMKAMLLRKDFAEIIVTDKRAVASNIPLVTKLHQLGILDAAAGISDSLIKQKVKAAQHFFDLLDDGVIRSTLLQEMNVPLSVRIHELASALNYYRWLHCFATGQKVIVVNIPAAYLKVYEGDSVILQMKLVVGKKSTPTPTLLSRVNEVVLYPYWHVPHNIATKELLPLIKRNTGFLEQGNYQVLNLQGKVVNPYSIRWRKLNARNFPYIIRQSTGCDNSLGLLKLNFYNPFGVYLHDTPSGALFGTNKRYYSHGCMRMEKPFDIGHLLFTDNRIAIDTLEEKGCVLNQQPVVIPVKEKMPVLVWYNPAGLDAQGKLVFYEDIYEKFFKRR